LAKLQFLINSNFTTNAAIRKTIHISGFLIPSFCLQFIGLYFFCQLLFVVMVLYSFSEVARYYQIKFPFFSRITQRAVISDFEKKYFAAAPITFTLGILFSLLFFPLNVAYVSISVLTLGDGFANVFGKIYGKTCFFFNKNKTVEGTFFGFIFAFLGALIFVNPLHALIAVFFGMFVETLPLSFGENLVIPLSSGLVLSAILFL
jgi:dolichol kinase